MGRDNVAMRYKGNSSLRSAYQMGVKKFSFRLNFDKYEDDYPQIEDQRFYGFKKMTFSNGFKDSSLLRDKVAAEMFRQGGVPVAMSSFARVYVNFGEVSTYFGLYTMIEDPSDEMIGVQFDDGSGNLYKPEGTGATWESFDEDSFEKKTNEESSDWSDIINAMDALHGDRTDALAWRTTLEKYFDTDSFLRCLAINQAMVNWDSYGTMNHNYYVYGNPAYNGRLVWFPWDLNEAMIQRQPGPGGEADNSGSVMLDEADDSWPLIRYLLDDDVYRDKYKTFLQNALDTSLDTDFVYNMLDEYHNLISPYVIGDNGESAPYTFLNSDSDFETSVSDDLKPHIAARRIAVSEELGL
ncbi:MAG: CotH kinase family protein [Deltaproteobacteria bacterium]|nr:CotH kinase family protein [Deltaproteobacteria bacterium]